MATVLAIAGSTGLVGTEAVGLAAADSRFRLVLALARRSPAEPPPGPSVRTEIVDYERLDAWHLAQPLDAAFCALGTTIRRTGSEDAFRQVDYDYALAFAKRAQALGARHFLLVSALGADPKSRIFYNRVKGELERDIMALGFLRLAIARPSVLLGDRTEVRFGELIAKWASRVAPRAYRGVHAGRVASGLLAELFRRGARSSALENRDLLEYPTDRIGPT